MNCPFCGAKDDCRHRESARAMHERWERQRSQKKAKEAGDS